jgi:hypothetical protein
MNALVVANGYRKKETHIESVINQIIRHSNKHIYTCHGKIHMVSHTALMNKVTLSVTGLA